MLPVVRTLVLLVATLGSTCLLFGQLLYLGLQSLHHVLQCAHKETNKLPLLVTRKRKLCTHWQKENYRHLRNYAKVSALKRYSPQMRFHPCLSISLSLAIPSPSLNISISLSLYPFSLTSWRCRAGTKTVYERQSCCNRRLVALYF